ncbi:MAG TPA: hypothetical protein V6D15_09430 [Oculatellaceae cyanobacterium]|jgi:hypothetical protein
MNQNNSYRDHYADALDLGERPQQEYIDYEIFDQEPAGNQQMVWMPGEGPVPVYNPNSITSFPWESYLTNSWLMAGVVGIATTLLVTVLATTQNQKNQAVAPVDNTLASINQANQVLTQARQQQVGAITKYDYNPAELTNPGLLQMAVFTSASEFNQDIKELQGSNDPLTKDKPKEILIQRSRVEVQKLIDLGASGRGVALVYEDPLTGEKVYTKLDPALTVAVGLVKILAIEASQRTSVQTYNMPEIAVATRGHQGALKAAQANLLGSQGWVQLRSELNSYDSYGQKIFKNPSEEQEQTPKKPEIKKVTKGKKDKGSN